MPNYVKNKINFNGSDKDIKELLERIKSDELGLGTIDFQKVIPMPEDLMIESGSRTTNGLKMVDSYIKENNLRGLLSKATADELKTELDKHTSELPDDEQSTWEIGVKSAANILKYGYPNWYDWSCDNWGTKWNACGYSEGVDYADNEYLEFDTAWSAPVPVIAKLSEMFPKIEFLHKWADEDFGQNVGVLTYSDGEISDYTPSSHKECLELASEVWEYDLTEFGYRLNQSGDDYVYTDGDDYELVELLGQKALFTNERVNDSEVPEGLYLYHIRMTDDGEQFGSLEPSVAVNHGGSILAKEPIDLGELGFIEFNEHISPNFLGQDMTMGEFLDSEFLQNEEIGQTMV
ncbi:MAG: hypothetical protein K6F14_00985 [Clostridiales bacterium]|nr:hypothetical protein [Clostridiales bacterium]